ncbi:DMT family transporter [Tabrizicola oligotrophica]|uniref:DMT family transporter n=1 Tax=Tabrizicola oligotrophica TaxID=2710650 RepID=UPI002AB106DB|nr:DMT family transporter [Tabrizicola oligotrophica]
MTRLPQGLFAILPAVFAMALTDAIIKNWSAGISLWQIWVLRSALVLPVLFVMARGRVRVARAGWVGLRCLALIGMYLTMYPALPLIDMALAGAAFYTAPLFIAGLSALVLGQRIAGRQWLAILVGFAGLLLIVRPFGLAFTPIVLLPVAAAFCYACAAILTRAHCMEVPPAVMGFWLNVAFLGFGGVAAALLQAGVTLPDVDFPFLLAPWQSMSLADWGTLAVLAVLMIGISVGVATAYKSPQPAVIAALEYCYMIFACFWGFVFFAEVPDVWTVIGTALIAASGCTVLLMPNGRLRHPSRTWASDAPPALAE